MPVGGVCGGYLTTHSAFGRGKERDVSVATVTIMVLQYLNVRGQILWYYMIYNLK